MASEALSEGLIKKKKKEIYKFRGNMLPGTARVLCVIYPFFNFWIHPCLN